MAVRGAASVPHKYLRTLFEEASSAEPRAEEAFRHCIGNQPTASDAYYTTAPAAVWLTVDS